MISEEGGYWKRNIPPILIEVVFVVSCFIVPESFYLYTNFVFYLLLLIYFIIRRDFSFHEWGKNLKSGKKFWKAAFFTILGMAAAFACSALLEAMFPDLPDGMINLKQDGWLAILIFAVSTIILPPLAEELFYRQSMISFRSRPILIASVIASMFLYALEHSLEPWGIFLTMLWALPLSISYIKTKNVYVAMTAHFLINLVGNGTDVVFMIMKMVNRV
ncbi:MAG: CPBP family intramembrane glutamic endopeptidase [Lachnospiraceae bacterium]|jgi:membrane protease YdiL (CAAX protease family)